MDVQLGAQRSGSSIHNHATVTQPALTFYDRQSKEQTTVFTDRGVNKLMPIKEQKICLCGLDCKHFKDKRILNNSLRQGF